MTFSLCFQGQSSPLFKLKLHTHVKHLGIFIDKVLSWNKQIDILCSKLSRANGILSKLRNFSPLKTCLYAFAA